jgi:hypothetical protein
MLKFNTLSNSQKKCIIALIEANPALKTTGQITLKEVVSITQDLAAKRTAGAPKIGYPNWLFKYNKIERGVYQLPLPTEQDLSDYAQGSVKQPKVKVSKSKAAAATRLEKIIESSPVHTQDVEDFNAILRENGITV